MNKTNIASYTTGTAVDTSSNSLAPLTQHRRGTKAGECPLRRRTTELIFHHLIPKKCIGVAFFKKLQARTIGLGIYICRQCHSGIHLLFDEMTLGKRFNTFENLLLDEALLKHFRWVARQKLASSLSGKV